MALFDWPAALAELNPGMIPAEWRGTRGAGVKLAFLDTGVDLSVPALKHLNKTGRKFFTGRPDFSPANLAGNDPVQDSFGERGHGTLYATLMAGRADDQPDRIEGLANRADFYIIKARSASGKKTTIRNLLDGLELAANLGVDIAVVGESVSMGELFFEQIPQSAIDRVFARVTAQKMLVFGALKNRAAGEDWSDIVTSNFPNSCAPLLNIAVAPRDIDDVRESIRHQNISFLAGGVEGKVHLPGNRTEDLKMSNSGAVAVLGGIAALCLGFLKQQDDPRVQHPEQILQLLGSVCASLDDATGDYPQPVIFKNF